MRIRNAKCCNAYRTSSPQIVREHNKLFFVLFLLPFTRLQSALELCTLCVCVWRFLLFLSILIQSRCRLHINPIAKNENSRFVSVAFGIRIAIGDQNWSLCFNQKLSNICIELKISHSRRQNFYFHALKWNLESFELNFNLKKIM